MNKYTWILSMSILILLITIVSNSVLVTPTSDITTGATLFDASLSGLFGVVGTYFKILSFQLDGFPAVLNLIVFVPLNLVNGLLIIDALKGLIPGTSGGS